MRGLGIGCAAVAAVTLVVILGHDYPLAGHDYRYFIPRLIDTDLHLRINGPAVQWFTPSFGGGLPAFANPQHLQYSLVQALTYVLNPWLAILVSTVVLTGAGFFWFSHTCRSVLGLHPMAAAMAALAFVANGFYIEHLLVGHLGFQLFPLSAVMLWALMSARAGVAMAGAVLGLTVAAMLYQAGFYLLLVTGASLALALPLLYLLRPGVVNMTRVLRVAALGGALGGAIAAPKIYAAMLLMQQFPRHVADDYGVSLWRGLAGLASQVTGVMTLVPVLAAGGIDVARVEGVFVRLTGSHFGIWESDTAVSPVVLMVVAIGAMAALRRAWREPPSLSRPQVVALAALAGVAWILVEAILARGLVYPFLKTLPVLSSLHVTQRLAGAFVLPLCLAAGVLLDRWLRAGLRQSAAALLLAATAVAPLSYLVLPARLFGPPFDLTPSLRNAAAVRAGERFPVERLAVIQDADTFAQHASSLDPYEPLFGYANEAYRPQARAGEVRIVEDGAWNMTHPGSLAFPAVTGLQPFDRVPAGDRDRLEAFLARRQPDWPVPPLLRALTWLALASALGAAALLVASARARTP
jgi:hypothetical protein